MDRIQRSRRPGSSLAPRTLCVDRSTPFGNPFGVFRECPFPERERPWSVYPSGPGLRFYGLYSPALLQTIADRYPVPLADGFWNHSAAALAARELFCDLLRTAEGASIVAAFRRRLAADRTEHLACWCPPGFPCHADVWLEIAIDTAGSNLWMISSAADLQSSCP